MALFAHSWKRDCAKSLLCKPIITSGSDESSTGGSIFGGKSLAHDLSSLRGTKQSQTNHDTDCFVPRNDMYVREYSPFRFVTNISSMIEVEIKYAAIPVALERIRAEGTFIKERRMRNVYWDSPTWELTRKCLWLRERDGAWELKVPIAGMPLGQAFHELETEAEICAHFSWNASVSVAEHVKNMGWEPFVDIATVREQWEWHGVHVDIDSSSYGNGARYDVVELELMAKNEVEAPKVREQIEGYAKELGLEGGEVYGKVLWYIREFRNEHFRALQSTGVA